MTQGKCSSRCIPHYVAFNEAMDNNNLPINVVIDDELKEGTVVEVPSNSDCTRLNILVLELTKELHQLSPRDSSKTRVQAMNDHKSNGVQGLFSGCIEKFKKTFSICKKKTHKNSPNENDHRDEPDLVPGKSSSGPSMKIKDFNNSQDSSRLADHIAEKSLRKKLVESKKPPRKTARPLDELDHVNEESLINSNQCPVGDGSSQYNISKCASKTTKSNNTLGIPMATQPNDPKVDAEYCEVTWVQKRLTHCQATTNDAMLSRVTLKELSGYGTGGISNAIHMTRLAANGQRGTMLKTTFTEDVKRGTIDAVSRTIMVDERVIVSNPVSGEKHLFGKTSVATKICAEEKSLLPKNPINEKLFTRERIFIDNGMPFDLSENKHIVKYEKVNIHKSKFKNEKPTVKKDKIQLKVQISQVNIFEDLIKSGTLNSKSNCKENVGENDSSETVLFEEESVKLSQDVTENRTDLLGILTSNLPKGYNITSIYLKFKSDPCVQSAENNVNRTFTLLNECEDYLNRITDNPQENQENKISSLEKEDSLRKRSKTKSSKSCCKKPIDGNEKYELLIEETDYSKTQYSNNSQVYSDSRHTIKSVDGEEFSKKVVEPVHAIPASASSRSGTVKQPATELISYPKKPLESKIDNADLISSSIDDAINDKVSFNQKSPAEYSDSTRNTIDSTYSVKKYNPVAASNVQHPLHEKIKSTDSPPPKSSTSRRKYICCSGKPSTEAEHWERENSSLSSQKSSLSKESHERVLQSRESILSKELAEDSKFSLFSIGKTQDFEVKLNQIVPDRNTDENDNLSVGKGKESSRITVYKSPIFKPDGLKTLKDCVCGKNSKEKRRVGNNKCSEILTVKNKGKNHEAICGKNITSNLGTLKSSKVLNDELDKEISSLLDLLGETLSRSNNDEGNSENKTNIKNTALQFNKPNDIDSYSELNSKITYFMHDLRNLSLKRSNIFCTWLKKSKFPMSYNSGQCSKMPKKAIEDKLFFCFNRVPFVVEQNSMSEVARNVIPRYDDSKHVNNIYKKQTNETMFIEEELKNSYKGWISTNLKQVEEFKDLAYEKESNSHQHATRGLSPIKFLETSQSHSTVFFLKNEQGKLNDVMNQFGTGKVIRKNDSNPLFSSHQKTVNPSRKGEMQRRFTAGMREKSMHSKIITHKTKNDIKMTFKRWIRRNNNFNCKQSFKKIITPIFHEDEYEFRQGMDYKCHKSTKQPPGKVVNICKKYATKPKDPGTIKPQACSDFKIVHKLVSFVKAMHSLNQQQANMKSYISPQSSIYSNLRMLDEVSKVIDANDPNNTLSFSFV